MELQEQINALTSEKNQYFEMLHNLNLEKIAIDQQLVETLKQLLGVKKDLLLANENLKKAEKRITELCPDKGDCTEPHMEICQEVA